MYKTLCVAVLLLPTFALTQARNSAATPVSPPIVARGKLVNQTAPIPTTTIFTSAQDGLYRLSAYATIIKADPSSSSSWDYLPSWTDDSGLLNTANPLLFSSPSNQYLGPFAWSDVGIFGGTLILEAKAGTPITYSVTQSGPPDNSAYSLYYTLERLE